MAEERKIILECDVCECQTRRAMTYTKDQQGHHIECRNCKSSVTGTTVDEAISLWNNHDIKVSPFTDPIGGR